MYEQIKLIKLTLFLLFKSSLDLILDLSFTLPDENFFICFFCFIQRGTFSFLSLKIYNLLYKKNNVWFMLVQINFKSLIKSFILQWPAWKNYDEMEVQYFIHKTSYLGLIKYFQFYKTNEIFTTKMNEE